MIYFLCVLLFITIICGATQWFSVIGVVIIDLALLLAILRVGGWL